MARGYDTDGRARARAAAPLPEERSAGIDDPVRQAEVILEESDKRQLNRDAAPDTVLEKRRSAETA